MSQRNPVHIVTTNFLQIHANIILPFMPWSTSHVSTKDNQRKKTLFSNKFAHTRIITYSYQLNSYQQRKREKKPVTKKDHMCRTPSKKSQCTVVPVHRTKAHKKGPFLTSAQDRSECSASCPGCLSPGQTSGTLNRWLSGA